MGSGVGRVNSPCGISVPERSKVPDPVRRLGIISRSQDDGRSTVFMNRPRENVKIFITRSKFINVRAQGLLSLIVTAKCRLTRNLSYSVPRKSRLF